MENGVLERKEHVVFEHEDMRLLDAELDRIAASYNKLAPTAEELAEETEAVKKYNAFLGSIALGNTVQSVEKRRETKNLIDLIEGAARGEVNATSALETNAHTTVIETILKHGNITRVNAGYDEVHGLQQFGHHYHDIQKNALNARKHSEPIEARLHAEGRNWKRIEEYKKAGLLEDNWYVVLSMVPDDAPIEDCKDEGFFMDTMTMVAQATTEDHDGVATESAFLAGIDTTAPNAQRHDLTMARGLYQQFGKDDVEQMSVTDFLDNGLLIPKKYMPNGVSDITMLLDAQLGEGYFFGARQQVEDYDTFAALCMEREQQYKDLTAAVVADLIAARHTFTSVEDAFQMMYDRAKYHAVKRASYDQSIDETVFGMQAAHDIQQSRVAFNRGDMELYYSFTDSAQETAVTYACGGGSKPKESTSPSSKTSDADTGKKDKEPKTEKKGKKEIMRCVHCPLCDRNDVDATIEHEPDKKRITCMSCHGHKDYPPD